ncbi:MAG: 2-oxo acid dehydrogenase subunit E2 [Gammaproteobacteria bacterium]|nr:2-oxo acid dehydrogenase subunit E2 [Gammaproteobacteria bacterium]
MGAHSTALMIPDLGEGAAEGTVVAVLFGVGAMVAAGQSLLEIETDKVTLEVPAECAGCIMEVAVEVGQTVSAGTRFATLAASDAPSTVTLPRAGDAATATPESALSAVPVDDSPAPASLFAMPPADVPRAPRTTAPMIPAGPAARREARELGVDLAQVRGTGPRQRISREDVRRHVQQHFKSTPLATPAFETLPDLATFGAVHTQALPRIARTTARNMARSASLIPHAWIQARADVTALEAARRDLRKSHREGAAPITLSVLMVRAVAKLLRAQPLFNAAYDAEHHALVFREYVNVGLAVATPRGLVVPVAREPLAHDLAGLAAQLDELIRGAREQRLPLRAYQGAGFTISNLGGMKVETLQPLVNWPELAILGVGALQETPCVLAGQIVVRQCLSLTLGFDHRVINGADAANFLSALVAELENPLRLASDMPANGS